MLPLPATSVLLVTLVCSALVPDLDAVSVTIPTSADEVDRMIQYTLFTEDENWNTAQEICRSINASLATIDTQEKLDFIAGQEWSDSTCGGVYTLGGDAFLSPGFPIEYESDTKYGWVVIKPAGRVALQFERFDIEDHIYCRYDFVAVYDGLSSSQLGKYCGSKRPFTVTASSRYMFVCLSTDRAENKAGFLACH